MSDDFAESFYAKMGKPEPAKNESPVAAVATARQMAQDRGNAAPVLPAKTSASRDVDASGGAGEMTVAELDEQRREEDRQRANALYDLPMDPGGDNPRFDEPVMDRFSAEIPDDLHANLQPGEGEQIGRAFIAAGLGNTTAASFMRMGVEASRRGPLSDHQIQQRNVEGMQALEQRWGDQTGAKLELAKGMIREAEKQWPGLRNYLNATGLGSDPKLIQQLVARAERRPGRNR
jgi:hypothetical protein